MSHFYYAKYINSKLNVKSKFEFENTDFHVCITNICIIIVINITIDHYKYFTLLIPIYKNVY